MILYFAGAEAHVKELTLYSVPNWLGVVWESLTRERVAMFDESRYRGGYHPTRIFVDSGAFSAYTKGVRIDIGQYADFLHRWKPRIAVYASLDVIGDWKSTLANFRYMKDRGLSPLWTFHGSALQHEPLSLLKEMIAEEEYVCLGGIAAKGMSVKRKMKFLDDCFNIIGQHWPRRVHGFGITHFELLKRYPFYSVDSTSWLDSQRNKRIMSMRGGNWQTASTENPVKSFGLAMHIPPVDPPGELHYIKRTEQAISALKKLESFITDVWIKRGIAWTP